MGGWTRTTTKFEDRLPRAHQGGEQRTCQQVRPRGDKQGGTCEVLVGAGPGKAVGEQHLEDTVGGFGDAPRATSKH